MTPAAELLTKAADLLAQPGKWTQGTLAKDADGAPTTPEAGDATCFCLAGAMFRFEPLSEVYQIARCHVLRAIDNDVIPAWNDDPDRTQDEVVAALRRAAAELPEVTQ